MPCVGLAILAVIPWDCPTNFRKKNPFARSIKDFSFLTNWVFKAACGFIKLALLAVVG